MKLSNVLAFALVATLGTACGQNEQESTAKDAGHAPILPPQQRLRCSIDGTAQSGMGVVVWRAFNDQVSAQVVTWTGGFNYTAAVPAQDVAFSVIGGFWDYKRPYFELAVQPVAFDEARRLHNATYYSQHIQQNLVCERLYR